MRRTLLLTLTLSLICSTALANQKLNLYTVGSKTVVKKLYYSGSISPIRNVPVISPTQGVVDKKNFIYGQAVKQGEHLLVVHSEKVENNLRDARVSYLKALEDYNKKIKWKDSTDVLNAEDSLNRAKRALTQAKNNYQQNKKLYHLGIISKDTLTQSLNTYQDSQSSYAQSKRALKAANDRGTGVNLTVSKLTLTNAKEKYESLKKQVEAHNINAPATGIILQPSENSDSSNNKKTNGKIQEGNTVTYQQVIMNIGDMSGLRISFSVPEVNINQIHKGEVAYITGAGFPGIKLSGKVEDVAAQAKSEGGGTVPAFPAVVVVPTLKPSQKKWIRAGMDAQIEIEVNKQTGQLTVPVTAIYKNEKGEPYVKLYDPGTQKVTNKVISFGTVNQDAVQITSGLKSGDQVILPSKTEG